MHYTRRVRHIPNEREAQMALIDDDALINASITAKLETESQLQ